MAKETIIVCKNVFKNTEIERIAKEYNLRWVRLINEYEKNNIMNKN